MRKIRQLESGFCPEAMDEIQRLCCPLFRVTLRRYERISYLWNRMVAGLDMIKVVSWTMLYDVIARRGRIPSHYPKQVRSSRRPPDYRAASVFAPARIRPVRICPHECPDSNRPRTGDPQVPLLRSPAPLNPPQKSRFQTENTSSNHTPNQLPSPGHAFAGDFCRRTTPRFWCCTKTFVFECLQIGLPAIRARTVQVLLNSDYCLVCLSTKSFKWWLLQVCISKTPEEFRLRFDNLDSFNFNSQFVILEEIAKSSTVNQINSWSSIPYSLTFSTASESSCCNE